MNKFEIGKRYKVSEKSNDGREGSIIEITDCKGIVIYYKVISIKTARAEFLGWFHLGSCFSECLEPVTTCSKKIVITSDGKTTTAKLYDGKQLIKSAEAKCSPDDTFDFETGAAYAYERLISVDALIKSREGVYSQPEIKAGDFVRIKNSNGIALNEGTIARVDRYIRKSLTPYELVGINWYGNCVRAYAQRNQLEKVDFNLEDFKAGKIIIEVNEKNIMECMKLLQRFGLNWVNKITDFNPYNSVIRYSVNDMYLRYECGIHYGIYYENSIFIKGFKKFKW